jgi:hypothetical protein
VQTRRFTASSSLFKPFRGLWLPFVPGSIDQSSTLAQAALPLKNGDQSRCTVFSCIKKLFTMIRSTTKKSAEGRITYNRHALVNMHYLQNENPYESWRRNRMVLCEECHSTQELRASPWAVAHSPGRSMSQYLPDMIPLSVSCFPPGGLGGSKPDPQH